MPTLIYDLLGKERAAQKPVGEGQRRSVSGDTGSVADMSVSGEEALVGCAAEMLRWTRLLLIALANAANVVTTYPKWCHLAGRAPDLQNAIYAARKLTDLGNPSAKTLASHIEERSWLARTQYSLKGPTDEENRKLRKEYDELARKSAHNFEAYKDLAAKHNELLDDALCLQEGIKNLTESNRRLTDAASQVKTIVDTARTQSRVSGIPNTLADTLWTKIIESHQAYTEILAATSNALSQQTRG